MHDANPDLGRRNNRTSARLGSTESINDHGRYLGQMESKTTDDTLAVADHENQAAPPVVQLPTGWADPAEMGQSPVPTHRDRLRHSGDAGIAAV